MRSISRCTDNSPASNFSAGRRSGRVMNPISRSAVPAAERDRKADVTFVGRFPSLPSEPKKYASGGRIDGLVTARGERGLISRGLQLAFDGGGDLLP